MAVDSLTEKAEAAYALTKERLRERYAYARSLGFSPREAKILAGWSRARIEAEAQKRLLAQSNETAP